VPAAGDVLSQRALNRALMARQGLLTRSDAPAADMIERLVGMQAQVPSNPYVALWSRLEDFDPADLSTLIADRHAVRAPVMRATIHLVSARDGLALQAVTAAVLARTFKSQFGRQLAGPDLEAIVAAGRELLDEAPRTRAELVPLLAPRCPGVAPATLGLAVTYHLPLVQIPPRGLWRESGQPRWARTERWLDAELDAGATVDALLLRYLAAFGPSTVADMRTWSTLTGLRAVVERLRPRLRTFRDERGAELFDVPDGALPDAGTPAPVRFLPEYDNALLSHADRSRVLGGKGPGLPYPTGHWIGQVLVDGFFRAYWNVVEEHGAATLTVDRFVPLPGDDPPGTVEAIASEGERLLAFIAPDAGRRQVRFTP